MYYKLENKIPVPCNNFAAQDIEKTEVSDRVLISTIFLSLDRKADAALFETAVFVDGSLVAICKTPTFEEAQALHREAVSMAKWMTFNPDLIDWTKLLAACRRASELVEYSD